MTDLHFAQISDIHISEAGDHDDLLSGRAATFLANICTDLNQIDTLDFVLFTGDLFDAASRTELEQFQTAIQSLQKPYYVIPGNHDRRSPDSDAGLTRHDFAQQFNPQIEARPDEPDAQVGYWSFEIRPDVQLIGLDSIKDDDWSGVIDGPQMEWLEAELITHADRLVIVAVHHPLHKLAPIDDLPGWHKFVCDNGGEMLALLDRHPQVKVVLTGHHHLTKVDDLGGRLHLACPAVAIYPCGYRSLRLHRRPGTQWQLDWQTHPATNEATIAEARHRMIAAWQTAEFEADFIDEHVSRAFGDETDRSGQATLRG